MIASQSNELKWNSKECEDRRSTLPQSAVPEKKVGWTSGSNAGSRSMRTDMPHAVQAVVVAENHGSNVKV